MRFTRFTSGKGFVAVWVPRTHTADNVAFLTQATRSRRVVACLQPEARKPSLEVSSRERGQALASGLKTDCVILHRQQRKCGGLRCAVTVFKVFGHERNYSRGDEDAEKRSQKS